MRIAALAILTGLIVVACDTNSTKIAPVERSTCWGESDCRGITTRATWEGMLFTSYGVLSHGG